MKVLISEDNYPKFRTIKMILEENFEIEELKHCESIDHTINELILKGKNYYDLHIQDMQIPMNYIESPDPSGGAKCIKKSRSMNLKTNVIICSNNEKRDSYSILQSYDILDVQALEFSTINLSWVDELVDFINRDENDDFYYKAYNQNIEIDLKKEEIERKINTNFDFKVNKLELPKMIDEPYQQTPPPGRSSKTHNFLMNLNKNFNKKNK